MIRAAARRSTIPSRLRANALLITHCVCGRTNPHAQYVPSFCDLSSFVSSPGCSQLISGLSRRQVRRCCVHTRANCLGTVRLSDVFICSWRAPLEAAVCYTPTVPPGRNEFYLVVLDVNTPKQTFVGCSESLSSFRALTRFLILRDSSSE